MISLSDKLWDFLTVAGTGLYNQVAGRVWKRWLPPGFDNSEKAVVMQLQTANALGNGAVHSTLWGFRCYGGSQNADDAETVARALYDRLHNARGTQLNNVMHAHLVTSQDIPPDPDTGWPARFETYRIQFTEDC